MSAPPLADPPTMPTMVSRLPKFCSRPTTGVHGGALLQSAPAAPVPAGVVTSRALMGAHVTRASPHLDIPSPAAGGVAGDVAGLPSVVRCNGLIRLPLPLSVKWRRGKAGAEREGAPARNGGSDVVKPLQQPGLPPSQKQPARQPSPTATQRALKKPGSPPVGKSRGFGFGVTPSSAPPQSSPKGLPVTKNGPCGAGQDQKAPGALTNGKASPNGLAGATPRWPGNAALKLPLRSSGANGLGASGPDSTPRGNKPPAGRSQSSDSLRSAASAGVSLRLDEKDRLRSRSLNQVQRQPSPTLPAGSPSSLRLANATRSYSLNRAADRGTKESAQSATAPRGIPRTPQARHAPPRVEGVGGPAAGSRSLGGGGGGKVQSSFAPAPPAASIPSLLPASHLKKSLLPSFFGLARSRPSLIKQPGPLRVTPAAAPEWKQGPNQGPAGRKNSVETPSVTPTTTDNSPGSTPEAPETEGPSAEPVSHAEVSVLGETLEDMSLSSASSLERDDTSQEYMDDFDNLGNGVGILLHTTDENGEDSDLGRSGSNADDAKDVRNDAAKGTALHSFLEDGMEWAGMTLSGDQGEYHLSGLSRQRSSSQPDYLDQGGSSLDLSPSDSCGSGGTYMWDEEGLEPLGGAVTTASITIKTASTAHHIGSYDSDLNSIDLLNNLDSCDLDDDDLMLDDDLPEDASLHSDADGMSHLTQWRMPQLCWGTQDVHNDNSEFQSCLLTEDPGNQRAELLGVSPARFAATALGLGVDVEELADDCAAVRAQLEHLRRLLLQEEEGDDNLDTLTTDTLSPESPEASCSEEKRLNQQVAELLQEVQQLREEVRSRDRTIAQLSQQLRVPMTASRCHNQETERRTDRHTQTRGADIARNSRSHQASQTPWKEHTPQVLHPQLQQRQGILNEVLSASSLAPPPASARRPVTPAATPADPRPAPPVAAVGERGRGVGHGGEGTRGRDREASGGGGRRKEGEKGAREKGPREKGPREGAARSDRRRGKEKGRAQGRSPQHPEPSKPCLLPPPTSRIPTCPSTSLPRAAGTALPPLAAPGDPAVPTTRTRALRQPSAPRRPENGANASGLRVRGLPPNSPRSAVPKSV